VNKLLKSLLGMSFALLKNNSFLGLEPMAQKRFLFSVIAALALTTAVTVAHATPITYDLTLTNTVPGDNVAGGMGTLTINSATTTASGFYTTYNAGGAGSTLTALSFLIDGQSLGLTTEAPGDFAQAGFSNAGALTSLTFTGVSGFVISINAGSLLYTYADVADGHSSSGTITSSVASATPPTSVPEPGSLLLLGTAALGLGMILSRRRA
jgi:hypothetical protein